MDDLLAPNHLILLALVALLLFGPRRLPELGAGLGRAMGSFRRALGGEEPGGPANAPPAPHDAPAAPAARDGRPGADAGDRAAPGSGTARR